ncbi:phosphomevalonate kinase [Leucobacter luti]|uniref:phosphomevalonate kinase n=1 Tax=Leucobacter luti TaxID=340320 RepID=UPI003D002AAE
MIEVRAPGKLFIAGEYAVVEPGEPAVLVAVDRFITLRLTESFEEGRVRSEEYGRSPLVWVRDPESGEIVREHEPVDYVFAAIHAVEQLRAELGIRPRYFDLEIRSELDDVSGRKLGLGSSAAVTVAVIAALDEFYGLSLTRAERFRLSLLATIEIAPNASGGDLAASTFGGWIRYVSPDRGALHEARAEHGVARALQAAPWQRTELERLPHPSRLRLLTGWTGIPASTERLVSGIARASSTSGPTRLAAQAGEHRPLVPFVDESRVCVEAVANSLRTELPGALAAIRRARRLMRNLGLASGIEIETPRLCALCDIAERNGAAAKPSGAGGGDCGIVLAPGEADPAGILSEWERNEIVPLSLSVHAPSGGTDGI